VYPKATFSPTVYVTRHVESGMLYLGVHKYDIFENDYYGSGKRFRYALKKYGVGAFTREVIERFDTYEEALKFEYLLSHLWDVKDDPQWYNLKYGGGGGTSRKCEHPGIGRCMPCMYERRRADKERRDIVRSAWMEKTVERRAAIHAVWRAKNKEHETAMDAAWYAKNKERKAATSRARYVRKKLLAEQGATPHPVLDW
jgi:hypothetical protein